MKKFQVVLDEETDRILNSLALDQMEEMQSDSLRLQRVRSERGFRKGKFTRWEEVKRKNRL